MNKLPGRIAFVIISTVLLFVVTTGVSIFWMTQALDRQAQVQTEAQVRNARTNLLAQVRLLTLDYAKWDAAYAAVRAADLAWIFDNIGSTAMVGQTIQLAVLWGGPFAENVGWTSDGGEDARTGLLSAAMLDTAERRLADVAPGVVDGTEFFAWHDGDLFVLGASRFEPVEHAATVADEDRFAGQLIMGIRITDDVVSSIADSILLTGADITRQPPDDRPSLALPGLDGRPVAYFMWDLPRPGTGMLQRMLPLLTLMVLLAVSLAAMGMRLVRRGAHNLVSAEQQASTAARTDILTGLPNRAAFNEALKTPARASERAILFLDLNGFKGVNDSLGHAAGDAVIAVTAARITAVTGPDCLLARIAGDEFVLLVTGRDARSTIERLARAVDRTFDEPFEITGHQIQLRAAIGYAVQDADDMSGCALMRQADLAMYEGKRRKQRAPVAFSTMMEDASHNLRLLERALRTALSTRPEEISVAYQPIVTADGRFCHAEALARWSSPGHGEVPPGRFVAVAEKAGLVMDLGRVVMNQVLGDLCAHPELRVSVNVSALKLVAPDFIPDLVAELAERSIDPARIEVELTESVLIKDPDLAAQHLHQLRSAGFGIALDDFGTGYSSIAYLEQLDFDTLKVDRSFVSGVRLSPKRHALLQSMVRMAHSLDLRVVCEGIETAEDMQLVRELQCDLVQGYWFDRPLTIDDLACRWLTPGGGGVAARAGTARLATARLRRFPGHLTSTRLTPRRGSPARAAR